MKADIKRRNLLEKQGNHVLLRLQLTLKTTAIGQYKNNFDD